MTLTIVFDGADAVADTRSLLAWLAADDALRGLVELRPGPARSGAMGSVSDVVAVALHSSGAAVALAGALSVWLRNRRSDVRATVSGARGTVTLDVRRARDPRALLEDLERITDALPPADGTDPTAR